MAFQPAPDLAEVIIKGELNNEDAFITMGFVNLSAWGQSDLQSLCTNVAGRFVATGLPNLPVAYTYRETVARDLRTYNGFEATSSTSTGTTGVLDDTCAPNHVTLAISFRSGLIGRSQRGRNYWPGFVNSDVVENAIHPARISALITYYQQFIGLNQVSSGWRWVVISREHNKLKRPAALSTPVTAVTVTDATIDSQRRRLPKRGS